MINLAPEQHRHECEIRYLLAMLPHKREWYLKQVADKRGQKCADKLREELKQ